MHPAYRLGLMHSVRGELSKEAGPRPARILKMIRDFFVRAPEAGVLSARQAAKRTGRVAVKPRPWPSAAKPTSAPAAAATAARTRTAPRPEGLKTPREWVSKPVELSTQAKGLLPQMVARLGSSISKGLYHIDPNLQRSVIRMAGGPAGKQTAYNIGLGAPALGLGTYFGLSQPSPDGGQTLITPDMIASGYLPPTLR